LQDGSGIPSATRLLGDLDRPDADGLPAQCVIVVDEAAMVGTRQLARLLEHAHAVGAKVVLVGDHHQLAEIEAGGAFAGLVGRLETVELTENRRQQQRWERDALAELRHGTPDVALTAYQTHDRLHAAPTSEQVRDRLVDDWWAARQAGGRLSMLAARHADVDELNRRGRRQLAAAGALGSDVLIGDRPFAAGDDVLARRNDYRIMIFNGARATITRIDEDRRHIEAVDVHGHPLRIPFAYAEAGHLTWGYATTVHKAQGATVHQTFVPTTRSCENGATPGCPGTEPMTSISPSRRRRRTPQTVRRRRPGRAAPPDRQPLRVQDPRPGRPRLPPAFGRWSAPSLLNTCSGTEPPWGRGPFRAATPPAMPGSIRAGRAPSVGPDDDGRRR
ncbi:MAG: AAA family ATPase, partial [Actinobacteria bacterium]|nr:AAA family ATPase [Actinomycetota bacterium]